MSTSEKPRLFALMKFGTQVTVSLGVLGFSMGMLASGLGETQVYLPLVTAIVGYWLPQPSLKLKRDRRTPTTNPQQSQSIQFDSDPHNDVSPLSRSPRIDNLQGGLAQNANLSRHSVESMV